MGDTTLLNIGLRLTEAIPTYSKPGFKWINGDYYPHNSSDWGTGEPNNLNGRQNCVIMGNQLFDDIDCDKAHTVKLVCQYPKSKSIKITS